MKKNEQEISLISIIIPCRNEEKFIGKCLDSIIAQDYPKEKLEVLVVDGMSEDGTREIVEESYIKKHSFIKIEDNEKKFTPFALNIGIKKSQGKIIMRMDAHTQYPPEYISRCVGELLKYDEKEKIGNVGGAVSLPEMEGFNEVKQRFEEDNPGKKYSINIAKSIALCLTHRFGAASSFRLGKKEPRSVDTVFGGCYRREALDSVSYFNKKREKVYFDEDLIRSQDLELNLRLRKAGWKIRLNPDIKFNYYPESNFREFFTHNIEDGIWATYPLKFGVFLKLRHYLPLLFVLSLIISLVLGFFFSFFWWLFFFIISIYILFNIYFSYKINKKENNFIYMFFAFICRHFGYGLGSIFGLIKIFKLWN